MANIGAAHYANLLGGNGVASRHQQRLAVSQSKDYIRFVKLLYADLTDIIHHFQANPQRRRDKGEDGITDEVVSNLGTAGYDASHDTSSGGHVDITVKLGRHSWIGEAKKDAKFDEGFLQLTTRYKPASGNLEHHHGGMLLYCTTDTDLQTLMNRWRKKFDNDTFKAKFTQKKNLKKVETTGCPISRYAFFSRHIHKDSGDYFVVRHMMVGLQFNPKDASGRKSVAKRSLAKKKKRKPNS